MKYFHVKYTMIRHKIQRSKLEVFAWHLWQVLKGAFERQCCCNWRLVKRSPIASKHFSGMIGKQEIKLAAISNSSIERKEEDIFCRFHSPSVYLLT